MQWNWTVMSADDVPNSAPLSHLFPLLIIFWVHDSNADQRSNHCERNVYFRVRWIYPHCKYMHIFVDAPIICDEQEPKLGL